MKKTILIFTSHGGNGHMAVTAALNEILGNDYTIVVRDIFSTTLKAVDPWVTARFKGNGTDCYNYLMTRGYNRTLYQVYNFGYWYYKMRTKKVCALLRAQVEAVNPDLVISVVPIINGQLASVTDSYALPLLIIPTDLDPYTFVRGLKAIHMRLVTLGLYYMTDEIKKIIERTICIEHSQVQVVGPVVRQSFFITDISIHKHANQVPQVMIMLGSLGVDRLISIVQSLIAGLKIPVHLLVCTGKNSTIVRQLEGIKSQLTSDDQSNITLELIPFTHDIAPIMARSDLLVTKTGTTSVVEALVLKLPMVLDAGVPAVRWEAYNRQFIADQQLGYVAYSIDQIVSQVRNFLKNTQERDTLFARLNKYSNQDARITIPALVRTLLVRAHD